MPADLARLDLHHDRRPRLLLHAQHHDRVLRADAPVPVLAAVRVPVAGRAGRQRERGAAVGAEGIAGTQLAAPVQREQLLEREARTFRDAAHLFERVRVVRLDERHPGRRATAYFVPAEARLALELAPVEVDRDRDLLARLLPVLAAALTAVGRVDLDQRQHPTR